MSLECGDEYTMFVVEGFSKYAGNNSVICILITLLLILSSVLNPLAFFINWVTERK